MSSGTPKKLSPHHSQEIIPFNPPERLHEVLNESWRIFKSQFIYGRHEINKEAPFQLHFAQIIQNVGSLYSLSTTDLFKVDLETKVSDVRGKNKYIDITCEYVNTVKAAIELKFKTKVQGAQDHARIDSYLDLESLEILVERNEYEFGKFYMITDSTPYINQSTRGVGTVFAMHDGHKSEPNKEFWFNSKGRENVRVNLKHSYQFQWDKVDDWFFLDLTIKKPPYVKG